MNSSPTYNMLIVICGLVIFGRFTCIFYMIRQTRTLFKILEVSFQNSSSFLLIFVYICIWFGMANQLPFMGAYEIYLFEQIMTVFADSMGGLYHPSEGPMEEFASRMPGWFIFVTLQLIVGLVALNTLIALMGDSFDHVQSNNDMYDLRTKVELLLELNDIYFWNKVKKAEKWAYLVIVQYV